MSKGNSPKEETRWFRTHFNDGGSVFLQTDESNRPEEIFRSLIVTAAPIAEDVYVITAGPTSSVLSKEFHENPPPNTEILTSKDLDYSTQLIRKTHDPSRSRLILFIDSVSEMIGQVGWEAFEKTIATILELSSQWQGVVYIHQGTTELNDENRNALTRLCDIVAEYDAKSKNWTILD